MITENFVNNNVVVISSIISLHLNSTKLIIDQIAESFF